jgi:tRNA(fMet)-specific endonuclease VapC
VKFLLDTDHISILQRQSGPEYTALSARIAREQPSDLAFCIISFHEQALGCHTYLNRARSSADVVRGYSMLDRVLDAFAAGQVLPFDTAAATVFDDLLAQKFGWRRWTCGLRLSPCRAA